MVERWTFRRRTIPLAATGLLFCVLGLAPGESRAADDCPVPPDSFTYEPTLPRLVASLKSGKPLTLVALGGASTEGKAAGGIEYSWPNQLGAALRRSFPDATITVVNLGKPRQTAAMAVERIETEVLSHKPSLVLWETGTVDAVRGVDLFEFRYTLESGIRALQPDVDVVLVDRQYSRWTLTMVDFEPYMRALQQSADFNDIPLFPRSALMRDWSESGEIDYSVDDKDKRRAMARKVYRCLGQAMAAFLTRENPENGR